MQYDAGIILGHFVFSSRQRKRTKKGIELLKNGKVKFLITTGGRSWHFILRFLREPIGELTKIYLIKNEVDENKIYVENKSVNTYQNAKFSLEIMKRKNLKSAVVITSASHMRRTKKIFTEVFSKDDIKIDFVVSDTFAGFWWTIWDYFWNFFWNFISLPWFGIRRLERKVHS